MMKSPTIQPRANEFRGIITDIKAADLPAEDPGEFSNAPSEFEHTVSLLWNDTQKVYVNACTANRFSENYLMFCDQLEKNIKQLGSYCLTKAVLEQNGMSFPDLSRMTIRELAGMVGYHLRKAHAALEGIYRDNHILGMTYLNWEFRWAGLDNRLRATEAKIQSIREGRISTDAILKKAEPYRDDPRTGSDAAAVPAKSLPSHAAALPIRGSMARMMLGLEKQAEKHAEAVRKEKERLLKAAERCEQRISSRVPGGLRPPRPFGMTREDRDLVNRENAKYLRKQAEALDGPGEAPEPDAPVPGDIGEAEARRQLMEDAEKRNDQEALRAIPLEDTFALHARWEKYTARVEREALLSRSGPPPGVRKALRAKRKKRK